MEDAGLLLCPRTSRAKDARVHHCEVGFTRRTGPELASREPDAHHGLEQNGLSVCRFYEMDQCGYAKSARGSRCDVADTVPRERGREIATCRFCIERGGGAELS